ncbi:MAG: leucine-rich repeat domain-containing protein [Clostridia bacterium]|nr:leucine-rich repeat domain-containing protein [Clostridia bacterium]
MKKTLGYVLIASAIAALMSVSAACRTPEPSPSVPPMEEVIDVATPSPEPVYSIRIAEKTDPDAVRARISEHPALRSVEIDAGVLSNEQIAALIDAYPALDFRYEVSVGPLSVSPFISEIDASDPETGCTVADIAEALPYLKALTIIHLGARTPEELNAELPLLPEGLAEYSVAIYGLEIAPNAETLDLTGLDAPSADTLAAALPYLPKLNTVVLGSREDPALAASFRAAAPALNIDCQYRFSYQDIELDESTETLDLTKIRITDVDELKRVLSWLPNVTHVEMVGCGLDNETMAALRDEFPEKGIVWEISLGFWGKLRTDATAYTTRSSKSDDEMKYRLTSEKLQPIQYCTELIALDLGHQQIEDISCLAGLTKLQILILADNRISDLTPLASMHDLIYLELFMNRISDVSPLSGLTNLKDLNICTNYISDLTPFYSLTSLERLWYSNNKYTLEDHNALQEHLPNCICDRTVWQETEHGWREHERYFWMRSFFKDSPRYKYK